jgi:protein involved in polysaccharide export with SLBB domain
VEDVERDLVRRLSREIRNPRAKISLIRRADIGVIVSGDIKASGRKVLPAGSRIMDAVSEAGGITIENPEWAYVTLVRQDVEGQPIPLDKLVVKFDKVLNLELMNGDRVNVYRRSQLTTHINITGEVQTPGWKPYPTDGSLLSAIGLTGGYTTRAGLTKATIQRGERTIPVDLTRPASELRLVKLEAGDVLNIPQNPLTYSVIGSINRPGPLPYPEKETLTVLGAIKNAGGPTPDAEFSKAIIYRASSDKTSPALTIPINLEPLFNNKKHDLRQDMVLLPGDILSIPSKANNKRNPSTIELLQLLPLVFLFRR